jgi:hypothetical protein
MSYNGTGTFVINTTGQPVVTGTVISSSVFNALTSDLATGLSTAITKDGQTTITNNIPFSNNKITGLGVATTSGDALSYGQAATVSTLTVSGLTSGRVPYATTAGLLTDSASLTFNGTTLTANTIGAFTLSGTIAGGGNQINNVVIGTSTPLAGSFTTVSATTSVTTPSVTNAGTLALSATGANIMTASTNGSERMRIDTSGNVGIGTSSPSDKLTVISSGTQVGSTNFRNIARIGLATNDASVLLGYDISAGSGIVASTNNFPLAFWTSSAGTYAERMRIDSSGNLTCAGVYSATVGATNRDVYVDNTGLIGYVSSIRASKTEIQNLADVSWLNQLNPVSFKYRKKDEDGNYTDETDGDIQYGMIAEDVEQVRPDLCFYDEVDGEQELRGIQYSKLVPVMLKAIQELNAEIAALKAKLN